MNLAGADEEAVQGVLTPLFRSLEMLRFIARHVHPPQFEELMASVGRPDAELRSALAKQSAWPAHLSGEGRALEQTSKAVLGAFDGLRQTLEDAGDIRNVYRALRYVPDALQTLYPLARLLPLVNRFFLDPSLRSDRALQQQFLDAPASDSSGVMQFDADGKERGGFWLYVPETYVPDRAWPVVMALHGGSGSGRLFLWSWLRDARSKGAILVAPTAVGSTWALMGADPDTPNLARILEFVGGKWNVDAARVLLTGMSDGGTFTYMSGLEAGSPFTHLAPVAAAFHPMLGQMADGDRLRGLPIHIIHGALDWMFPVELARQARDTLLGAGAAVTYRELDDLSHTYPTEINAEVLSWLDMTAGPRR
jgi:phospholipase/carboxylesterase